MQMTMISKCAGTTRIVKVSFEKLHVLICEPKGILAAVVDTARGNNTPGGITLLSNMLACELLSLL